MQSFYRLSGLDEHVSAMESTGKILNDLIFSSQSLHVVPSNLCLHLFSAEPGDG